MRVRCLFISKMYLKLKFNFAFYHSFENIHTHFFYRCLLCYNIKIIISSRLFAFSTFQSSNKFRTNFLFIFFMWSVSDICFFLRSFSQYHVCMRFGTHVYLYECTLRLILHIHLTRIGFILTCFFSPIIFLSLFFFISFLWGTFFYDVLNQG